MSAEPDQLDELLRQVSRLRTRYAEATGQEQQLRLENSLRRRRNRIMQIRHRIEELSTEAATLDRELLGYQTALVAYLADLADRLRTGHDEGWSPTPVIGYRMWVMHRDRLEGVRTVWLHRKLKATCAAGYDDVEIPHTDGRCGRLGCGVYAAMSPEPVLESFTPGSGLGYVAGRVEMTGKVVEHDTGYRAELAETVAVVAVGRRGTLATRDPGLIEQLFASPQRAMETATLQAFWTRHMIVEFLSSTGEDPWILESSGA